MRAWLLAALLLWAGASWAHKASDSYLALSPEDAVIQGQWDIALRDLDFAIGLDADGDGAITWGELRARHADIAAYALARLAIRADGQPCPTRATGHLVDRHTDGAYAVLRFTADCLQPPQELEVEYRLLFDLDPQHKGLLRLETAAGTAAHVFSPDQPVQRLPMASPSALRQFSDYFVHGVWHIWIGYDHILFLLSLLFPAVLVHRGSRWQGVADFHPAFWEVLKIVTSFTVAHSITLTMASLGLVSLPSRLVESAIAASVVLAAANNLRPAVERRRWVVAFVFGLVHGFGFASVLADLGLPRDALALALLGFNLGVEGGQLAIVVAFLPLAYALRGGWFYRNLVFRGGSAAIMLVAAAWFVERAFALKFMPF